MTKYTDSRRQPTARSWRRVALVALLVTTLFALALLLRGNDSRPVIAPGASEKAGLEVDSRQPDEAPPVAIDPPVEPLSAPLAGGDDTSPVSPKDIVRQVARLLDKSAALDSRQLAAMIRVSGNPALPLQDRIAAIYWLARLASDEAIEALELLLASDTDPAIRDSIAIALGESGNPAATGILLGLLADADLEVVLSAIEGLASRHDPAIRQILLDLVADEQQRDEVRAAAAAALGNHDNVASDLLLAFEDSEGELAAGLLTGLARQAFVHGEPVFRKLLADPNAPFELKLEAIGALAEGSPEAAGLLLELARDNDDPELRSAAIDALAFADEGGSRSDAFAELALNEPSAEVRASLYNTLSLYAEQASAEPAAAKLVINTLAETEPHTRLEGYRMVASMLNYELQPEIAATFDNSMVPWLQRSAEFGEDKYTRFISIDALGLANTPGARQALGELSYSADPAVAQAALEALRLAEQSARERALP
jgi:HEAT repeat protein